MALSVFSIYTIYGLSQMDSFSDQMFIQSRNLMDEKGISLGEIMEKNSFIYGLRCENVNLR